MKKLILNMILVCFVSVFAQDMHFSQVGLMDLYNNPAAVGSHYGAFRFNAAYRDQWRSIINPYRTAFAGLDYGVITQNNKGKKPYVGIGLNFLSDEVGATKMKTVKGSGMVSVTIPVGRSHRISAGGGMSYASRSINLEQSTWDNQYDANLGGYNGALSSGEYLSIPSFSYNDYNIGILYQFGRKSKYIGAYDGMSARVGVALHNIGRPQVSFDGNELSRLDMRFVAHGELKAAIYESDMYIRPGFQYYQQGPLMNLVVGTSIGWRLSNHSIYTKNRMESNLEIGVYYRVKDAMIFMAKAELTRFYISFAYDANMNRLYDKAVGNAGFEIAVGVSLPNHNGNSRERTRTYF